MNGRIIYDSETQEADNDELYCLFDNEHEGNKYILVGYVDTWKGKIPMAMENVFNSLYEAIQHTFLRSSFEYKVVLYPYGELVVYTSHNDGVNKFEIRQLNEKGYEMFNNWKSVNDIIKCKKTTKNAHFKM